MYYNAAVVQCVHLNVIIKRGSDVSIGNLGCLNVFSRRTIPYDIRLLCSRWQTASSVTV